MRRIFTLIFLLTTVSVIAKPHAVNFQKVVIDTRFVAEGACVGDVNHDGKLDIMAGNIWYEAPSWTPHEIAPYQKFDPEHAYSNAFICFASDVNSDGWVDEIVVGFPGEKAVWRENPKGQAGPWKEHFIFRSACNESPNFADVLGNKKPVLVMGYDDSLVAWLEPDKDPNSEWLCHTVSEKGQPGGNRFSHGLGVGDINSDGRADIMTTGGWWEAPVDPRKSPWTYHPANLGQDCANMIVYDVNGDGVPDVLSSSAHNYGVWCHEQKKGVNGPEFTEHLIDKSISETHAIMLSDLNGDGTMDLITGKRFWAHGPTGDPGAGEPAMLVWYELQRKPGKQVEWVKHVIDEDSGVGTQFSVVDMNKDGKPDIIISNKKGVSLFLQK